MGKFQSTIDAYLQPGEYLVGDARHRISTLLGSCVSIVLWQPARKIGAISHFLLPDRNRKDKASALDARYGDESMMLILQELNLLNISPDDCEAKVFGGGDMFPGQAWPGAVSIGRRNGEMARALLGSAGIPIVSESLFGAGHRQIVFDVATGDVWSRQIKPTVPPFARY